MSDWSMVFGSVDVFKFDKVQREELFKGISEGIPYQLYADPNMSAFEMKEMRVLLSRSSIARSGPTAAMHKGMHPGFISYSNYKSRPDEVCYIPENWDMEEKGAGYTAKDILFLCGNDQEKADMVFALCDWQDPSTILDEWDWDDDIALLTLKKEKLATLQKEIATLEKRLAGCKTYHDSSAIAADNSCNTQNQLDTIIKQASLKQPSLVKPTPLPPRSK